MFFPFCPSSSSSSSSLLPPTCSSSSLSPFCHFPSLCLPARPQPSPLLLVTPFISHALNLQYVFTFKKNILSSDPPSFETSPSKHPNMNPVPAPPHPTPPPPQTCVWRPGEVAFPPALLSSAIYRASRMNSKVLGGGNIHPFNTLMLLMWVIYPKIVHIWHYDQLRHKKGRAASWRFSLSLTHSLLTHSFTHPFLLMHTCDFAVSQFWAFHNFKNVQCIWLRDFLLGRFLFVWLFVFCCFLFWLNHLLMFWLSALLRQAPTCTTAAAAHPWRRRRRPAASLWKNWKTWRSGASTPTR